MPLGANRLKYYIHARHLGLSLIGDLGNRIVKRPGCIRRARYSAQLEPTDALAHDQILVGCGEVFLEDCGVVVALTIDDARAGHYTILEREAHLYSLAVARHEIRNRGLVGAIFVV